MKKIIIATRSSDLALYQANLVKKLILQNNPELEVKLNIIKTQGDKILNVSLAKIGGKGIFVKEIDNALLASEADIAVHSMKDVPSTLPKGLILQTILPRGDASDSFISNKYDNILDLPKNTIIGTSSLRRIAQISRYFKGEIKMLRGNVNTRLKKLDNGEYDAIILATAGLKRLNLTHRIKQKFTTEQVIPACGQGAIGVECRASDSYIITLLKPLNCLNTNLAVETERAFNQTIGGSCQFPAGCYVEINKEKFTLKAFLSTTDGQTTIDNDITGLSDFLPNVGIAIGEEILNEGGKEIIAELSKNE